MRNPTEARRPIFQLIEKERLRQHDLWNEPHPWGIGDCSNPDMPNYVKAMVLTEETGEVNRAVLDHDPIGLVKELVEVAAVAVAWLEALEGTGLPMEQ